MVRAFVIYMNPLSKVFIETYGKTVELSEGSTLADAAFQGGVTLATPCGRGRCQRCVVEAKGMLSEPSLAEMNARKRGAIKNGERLACQALVLGDVRLAIPKTTLAGALQILERGEELPGYTLDPNVKRVILELNLPSFEDQAGDRERVENQLAQIGIRARCGLQVLQSMGPKTRILGFRVAAVVVGNEVVDLQAGRPDRVLGVAFDIGTTTVVGYLMDLTNGQELAVASALNPQSRYGSDVISRITFTIEHSGGLNILSRAVRDVMNELIAALCTEAGVKRNRIYEAVVNGNATMQHLFLKVDPRYLSAAPYVPVTTGPLSVASSSVGLRIHPRGKVFLLPSIGSFLGADTTGVLLATRFYQKEGPALAMDFGTNVELIGRDAHGQIFALSAPAGPAFEGGQVSKGLPGVKGAIDHVKFAAEGLIVNTIGGARPIGVCGSGLIDALALMLNGGAMTRKGLLLEEKGEDHERGDTLARKFVASSPEGLEFVLTAGERYKVSITQRDIRELQLAKGAITACTKIILRAMGAEDVDLKALFLAGAFGTYINKAAGQAIGLLPRIPFERIHSVGNAAGSGAKLALLSKAERIVAEKLVQEIQVINAVKEPDFEQTFLESMYFG